MNNNYRLTTILQIFTVILVFKSISATYRASEYTLQNQLSLISYYGNITGKIIPIFLSLALILMVIPWFIRLEEKTQKWLDYIALGLVFFGLLWVFLF